VTSAPSTCSVAKHSSQQRAGIIAA
jgi:hypothetical protein